MLCETCVDGQDLAPGCTCNVCGRTKAVTGYRKYEYPMTKEEEKQSIPITEVK